MIVRNADVWRHGLADVRIEGGRIISLAPPSGGGDGLDARGGALLPGLHDHHIHLAGLAVRAESVWCGPPQVDSAAVLEATLARQTGSGWIRGIGYHESVMGLPGAAELDRLVAERPLRIQHRSGRMWLLNSAALALLLEGVDAPPGMEHEGGAFTGRLFDEDEWLQRRLAGTPPDFAAISRQLAGHGVTGITDMTVRNGLPMAVHFLAQQAAGALRQRVIMAGTLALAEMAGDDTGERWQCGPAKLHLHEAAMPDFDETMAFIAAAHDQGRGVAVHCVSETELVFALAALEAAGACAGDRIEHASVVSIDLSERIAASGLSICVQPGFVLERGDAYRRDVEPRHQGDLYRLASLAGAGLALAGGSDAPFCAADPWIGMRAAVDRRTAGGVAFGPHEALSPEAALALYIADPFDFTRQRGIDPGADADLVLLDRPWRQARERLSAADVRLTIIGGEIVDNCIDQPPAQRGSH